MKTGHAVLKNEKYLNIVLRRWRQNIGAL